MSNTLQEWAPLSDLFNRLPLKAQHGIFTSDIKLTCIDVLSEFLALGTNFGLIYWYDRKKKNLEKLRCENVGAPITFIKIVSTVDYMVACGNKEGQINIFQVPKSHPESLPENLRPKNKQIERYTVSELHNAPISALEWSKNGMKLFSGDKSGHVVLTEIDFYMHLCKSAEILNESYEVVQLSYHQQNLLVSTTYRSIVCKKEDKWKVSQVGKKDRKVLGNYGGTFYKTSLRPNDVVLYCTRPGLRVWVADVHGLVQQTLLFKDILNRRSPEVPLINPISKNLRKLLPQKEASFGTLLPFHDNLLVTYSNDVVYILDPKQLTINAMISNLRSILWVSVHKDEIFILEGERSLIRISDQPEPLYKSTPTIPTATNFLPLTTSIKDLTNKLQSSSIISAIPPFIESTFGNNFNIHTDSTSIINAEEATESPIKTLATLPSSPVDPTQKRKIYEQISNQNFDDTILFKHRRGRKTDMTTSMTSWNSNSSEERDPSIVKPTVMTMSTVGILPDLRSPESIKNDIESKEKMLADLLCFDKVKISSVEDTNPTQSDLQLDKHSKEKSMVVVQKDESFLMQPSETASAASCSANPIPEVPVCMNIPNDWQLEKLQIIKEKKRASNSSSNKKTNTERKRTESSVSDLSGEWEIV